MSILYGYGTWFLTLREIQRQCVQKWGAEENPQS